MNDSEKTKNLTDLQKHILFEDGTEAPFQNEYWDNKDEGIYVDPVDGKALFSSHDKFDSGSGWPSFTKPIDEKKVLEKTDHSLGKIRTEVRAQESDIHLGHVFSDGPQDKGGMRYCINSASLRFVPKDKMAEEGYEAYLILFDGKNDINHHDQTPQKAVLAGGCFWGMEALFSKLDGVLDVTNGYSGGNISHPTYEMVRTGTTNHAESVAITFDPKLISYEAILRFFFQIHDATQPNQQGNDLGTHYRSIIFYNDEHQRHIAQDLIQKANQSGVFPGEIVTELSALEVFYKAEDYHQDYLEKTPGGYTCHRIRDDWQF